ncbi:MAG TPA: anti-sigma factor antagonist [Gammaproteobacteria bacterium]|nr:anti-sigma factor antagonist [Gammaproteobacteria bacterium]
MSLFKNRCKPAIDDHVPVVIEKQANGIRLSGSLDFYTVPELENALDESLRNNQPITIDLSGVSRSDSAGIALMIEWLKRATQANVELTLLNLPTQMQNITRVSNLAGILPLQRSG